MMFFRKCTVTFGFQFFRFSKKRYRFRSQKKNARPQPNLACFYVFRSTTNKKNVFFLFCWPPHQNSSVRIFRDDYRICFPVFQWENIKLNTILHQQTISITVPFWILYFFFVLWIWKTKKMKRTVQKLTCNRTKCLASHKCLLNALCCCWFTVLSLCCWATMMETKFFFVFIVLRQRVKQVSRRESNGAGAEPQLLVGPVGHRKWILSQQRAGTSNINLFEKQKKKSKSRHCVI